jgi:SAM-dependent MidA family methyltransferase
MSGERRFENELRKLLIDSDLSFYDFVELALYHPEGGYYARAENPVGMGSDYITAPVLSPVFSYAFGKLIDEFLSLPGDAVSTVVDVGCGDGKLIRSLADVLTGSLTRPSATLSRKRERAIRTGSPLPLEEGGAKRRVREPAPAFFGVDRSLTRIKPDSRVNFVRSFDEVPRNGRHLIICNELFDAFPFARLVQRGEHLHELWVTEKDGLLDWTEHEASPIYEDYFAARSIELQDGQFADLSLEWEAFHEELCAAFPRALIVTLDYGFRDRQLFDPRIRRFGTAASYSKQRVTRDLLSNPGERDLTAHINFSDLERAGERRGFETLFFDGLAKFLLTLGVTDHPLFAPIEELPSEHLEDALALRQERENARRLVLPDGIGEDMRVLVQIGDLPVHEWSFQRKLFS